MTLCAAGLLSGGSKGPAIIAVSDRRASFWGGLFSSDGAVLKMEAINQDWVVMIAGDLSPMVPLLEALHRHIPMKSPETVRDFAHLCSRIYREERKLIIKSEVLTEFDLDTYEEYQALRTTDEAYYNAVKEKVQKAEEGWNLLFFGFDSNKEPHIFVITEHGRIQYCDLMGYAAIGIGSVQAHISLSRSYKTHYSVPIAVYNLLSAKFDAESADGVGPHTLCYIKRTEGYEVFIASDTINKVRKLRDAMPRLPEHVIKEITDDLEEQRARLSGSGTSGQGQ